LCWEITGVITKSDLKALAIAIEIINRPTVPIVTPLFRLNSAGGDVDTAIAIGRQLRKYYATAMVWDNGGCYSSCVFIYAGAVRRMSGDSSIGIHRPYLNSTEYRDFQTIQNDQRRLEKLAKEYLLEVNVSPSLYDAMISTPPEKIRMLTQDEQQAFGLLPIDPVQQELWDSSEARRRNLTKGEYIRRKAQANITCANDYKSGQQTSNFDRYTTCYEDVLINRR
jgi:hypothetical protein